MLTVAAFGALAGAMLIFPLEAAEAARRGLGLWAAGVAPVLGPFMACMLMVSSRLGSGLWPRVLMGWLCGSPGGAKLMQPASPRGRTALRCAALTGTMSPMFFLGTIGGWLGSPAQGMLLLSCHVLGAWLLGLCVPADMHGSAAAAPLSLAAALGQTAAALALVALCMMLGCVSARMAACALPGLPEAARTALQCALEVTSGVRALIQGHPPLLLPAVCAACSFGGLSLLLQNAACWRESGVGAGTLLLLRAAHALIAFSLCLLLTRMLY